MGAGMHDALGGFAGLLWGAKLLSLLCWPFIASHSFVAILRVKACYYPTVALHNGPFVSRHEGWSVPFCAQRGNMSPYL